MTHSYKLFMNAREPSINQIKNYDLYQRFIFFTIITFKQFKISFSQLKINNLEDNLIFWNRLIK